MATRARRALPACNADVAPEQRVGAAFPAIVPERLAPRLGTRLGMRKANSRRHDGARSPERSRIMNKKQIALAVVLADFSALTAYVVAQYGFVGVFEAVFANWATTLAMVDLTIALTMVMAWMWQDAK